MPRPGLVIIIEWAAFALSWALAAGWSSAAQSRLGIRREATYRLVLIAGAVVLAIPTHGYQGPLRLWFVTLEAAWACIVLIALGFGFAWWANSASVRSGPAR